MIEKIHDNLDPINLNLFAFTDWLILIFFIIFFIWIYFKLFYIKETQTKLQKNNNKIINYTKTFNFNDSLLKLKDFENTKDWKNFALKATEILKLTLEKKYKENFLFTTRNELIEILDKKDISIKTNKHIQTFFNILDPIKFTKNKIIKSEPEEIIKILKQTYE